MKKDFLPIYYVLGAVLLVVVVSIFFYQKIILKEELSEFELSPKIADAAGIVPNTTFVLKSTVDLSATVVKRHLKFEPQTEYEIKKVSSGSSVFEITPTTALNEDQVYSIKIEESPISLKTYSWAYQVKAPFQVISSLPRDKANGVPINTGIEITFNRENLINPQWSFEISPPAQGRFETFRNVLVFVPLQKLSSKTIYTIKIKSGIKAEGSDDTLSKDTEIKFETGEEYSYEPRPYFSFDKAFWEFKPGNEATFGVNYSNLPFAPIPLTVYKFENAEDFLATYKSTVNEENSWSRYHAYNIAMPSGDKKIFESNVVLEEQARVKFLRLPQKLDEGFYLADVFFDGRHEQSWFQVTPIAGFSAISGTQTLLWLKDLNSGGSNISNANISFEKNNLGKTNSDGVAMFETPGKLIMKQNELGDYYFYSPLSDFYTVSVNGKELAIPIENEYGYFFKISPVDSWWDYFSIDKGVYLPTDKVHFWGIVKQRNGADIKGEEVVIQLTNPFWGGTPEKDITIYGETRSAISDFYTLTGEINFSDLKPGLYQLSVKYGKETIVSENVNIQSYIKPAYKLILTSDKNAVFGGDTVTYKVKAEFFDGTPVTNLELTYRGYLFKEIMGNVKLNQEGEGFFAIKTEYQEEEYNYWPRYMNVNVSPVVAEEGEISANISVLVFGPEMDLRIEQSFPKQTSNFDLNFRKIVLDKIQAGQPWWNSENYLGDPISGWNITAEVSEIIYRETEIDKGYDTINKVVYPIYSYTTEYQLVRQDNIITDSAGNARYQWTPEEKKSYRITFSAKDSKGRLIQKSNYVYGDSYSYFGFYDPRGVTLKNLNKENIYKLNEPIDLQMQDSSGNALESGSGRFIFIRINNGISSYQITDSPNYSDNFKDSYIPNVEIVGAWFGGTRFLNSYPINLPFDSNERLLKVEVKKDKEKYRPQEVVNLSIKVTDNNGQPKQAEVNVSGIDEAVFSLNPNEKDIAGNLYKDIFTSLIIWSSHYNPMFEGGGAEKGCFVAGTKVLTPMGQENIENLRIGDEIVTWGEDAPGGLVRAKIKRISSHLVNGYFVINKKLQVTMNHRLFVNGLWKETGQIEIGDILLTKDGLEEKITSLKFVSEWRIVYNIELDKYHTYFADNIYVHNEGKGDDGVRSDFRDVAIYKTVRTNSTGYAEVSFNVPDNLTSWRLTTQAVTKDLFAGKSVDFVPVGLPFFVETALNKTYLLGDSLILRARVFGTANIKNNITYTIESETLPFKKIEKIGSDIMEISLGNLPSGKHQLKISARAAGYSDSIIREVNVLNSYFSQNVSEFYELSPVLSNIQGAAKGFTTLVFNSYERGRFYNALRWLTDDGGARIDQKFTGWLAKNYLNRFFEEKNEIEELDIRNYQTYEGGIALLPYSDNDLALSAKLAQLIKDESTTIDKESLKRYFNSVFNDRESDLGLIIEALYGLSSFKEPILVTLQNIKLESSLTLIHKIYIALALDNLGAKEEARDYYKSEIKSELTTQNPYVFVNKLKNQDDNIIATTLLAGLTASLSEPESDGLSQYAIENYPKDTLKNFELLLYFKAVLPKLSSDKVGFSWQTLKRNGSKILEKNEVFRLELSPEELATLKFSDINGRMGLVSNFEKESLPMEAKKDTTISLIRSYSVDGRPTTQFSEGDLVRIDFSPTFAPNALGGSYQIVDYLPSGLRAVTNFQSAPTPRDNFYPIYPVSVEDQRVTFVIWESYKWPIFYYARVVSKGNYKAEPALIQSLKSSDSSNISEAISITIK